MAYRNPLTREFVQARVELAPSGCWLWAKSLDRHGYGLLGPGAQERLAHRLAYALFVGPIPDGMTVDHKCFVTHCVNPDHLQLLTFAENVGQHLDRNGARREVPTRTYAKRTHCHKNHALTDDNVYIHPKRGTRHCRTCDRARRTQRVD